MPKVNFIFPQSLKENLESASKELGKTESDIVCEAVDKFIKDFQKEKINQQIIAAKNDYPEILA